MKDKRRWIEPISVVSFDHFSNNLVVNITPIKNAIEHLEICGIVRHFLLTNNKTQLHITF
jgi:hypothetical protein